MRAYHTSARPRARALELELELAIAVALAIASALNFIGARWLRAIGLAPSITGRALPRRALRPGRPDTGRH